MFLCTYKILLVWSFCLLTQRASAASTVPTHVTASTRLTVCNKCYDEDNCYTIMSFVTGYMSGIGTSVFVVAISIVVYRIIQRLMILRPGHVVSIAKKPNNDNQGNSTAEMSTHYNEHAAQNHEPEQVINEENNYESLSNSRNTDAVYKGMEVQVQQGQGYYNIDAINGEISRFKTL